MPLADAFFSTAIRSAFKVLHIWLMFAYGIQTYGQSQRMVRVRVCGKGKMHLSKIILLDLDSLGVKKLMLQFAVLKCTNKQKA